MRSQADRTSVTVRDAARLEPVAMLRPEGADRQIEAGLSGDGSTVATFRYGADVSAQLWDVASGRTFAILRLPSPSIAEVFTEGGKALNKATVAQDGHFRQVVRSLAPAATGK